MNWIQKACESMKTHPNNVGSNFNVADLSKRNHEKAYVTMTAGKGDYGIVREPCPVHLRNHDGGAFHREAGAEPSPRHIHVECTVGGNRR